MFGANRSGLGLKTKVRQMMRIAEHQSWPDLPYDCVNLIYWAPGERKVNFGDELARVVVPAMLGRAGRTPFDETSARRDLLAIGSILHFAPDGATVWGSGANIHEGKERPYGFSTLDVRAVRGPHTAEFLRKRGISVPDVYGDPALLLKELFPDRFRATGEEAVGIVPNFADLDLLRAGGRTVISPMRGWNRCIEDILKCRLVLSSSLYGIVIAETWGIPARYVRLSDAEGLFKYRDYYAGTGRPSFEYARSIEEALEMGGEAPPIFDSTALKNAFPYDLWD